MARYASADSTFRILDTEEQRFRFIVTGGWTGSSRR